MAEQNRMKEQEGKETMEDQETREDILLHGKKDSFGIYQLKEGEALHDRRFENLDTLSRLGMKVEKKNYELVYAAPLRDGQGLNEIFEEFNLFRPEDFTGHSLSVSDIVLLNQGGENVAQYVDSFGFQEIPNFLEPCRGDVELITADRSVLLNGQREVAYAFGEMFLSIQECDEGYDYSIYDKEYKLLDGGIYENQTCTIWEAAKDILDEDKGKDLGDVQFVDYEELEEKTERKNRIQEDNPVAKVEELEEVNANQIDGILSNIEPKPQEKSDKEGTSIMKRLEVNRGKIAKEAKKVNRAKESDKKPDREMD